MQISELARSAQLTPGQVRHYERQGLLSAPRNASGYRDYPPGAAAVARRIGLLVELGFTTAEVRAFIERLEEPARDHAASDPHRQRLAAIDEALAALREARAHLVALLVIDPSEVKK